MDDLSNNAWKQWSHREPTKSDYPIYLYNCAERNPMVLLQCQFIPTEDLKPHLFWTKALIPSLSMEIIRENIICDWVYKTMDGGGDVAGNDCERFRDGWEACLRTFNIKIN